MSEIPLIQHNKFATDAEEVRTAVINGGFSTEMGPDGALYTGISTYPVDHWYENISQLRGHKISPKLSCFRLNLAGELPHSWVHSDDICAKFASVLYLNPPEQCSGGTAFWRHKELGIDRLPTRGELANKGINSDSYYSMIDQEWKKLEAWEQTHFIPMSWNRFITYPTCFFHSRYPFEAFGTSPKDGRLIWICFYDIGEKL